MISNFGVAIPIGHESRIQIEPQIMDATDNVRAVPLHPRKCIFANERNLTYFRLVYYKKSTQRNVRKLFAPLNYLVPTHA